VNIGLVNEIALMCEKLGIDVWEVVDAAKTKPFGFMPFYPGPGLGGHCIPIDPFYLSWKAKQTGFEPRFIELAGAVNSAMPHAVVDTIADALNLHKRSLNGSRVLIAGLTYKRDIDDIRESPSLDVMSILQGKGAKLSYVDPHVPALAARQWAGGYDLASVPATRATFGATDCIVILTDHHAFDYQAMIDASPLIVDTRNAIKQRYPHVFRIGASNAHCEAPVAG
jgi:UDP-N-acetyl-D-glucosamine dehydrogenase